MKIRLGNDFVFNWAITRGGLPEDLTGVLDAKLTVSVFGKKQEVSFTKNSNIVTVEFTPSICNIIGTYNLKLDYILPDTTFSDEDRKCTIDVDAFQIVPKTALVDDSSEFSVTSDMAIAFQGKSAYDIAVEGGYLGTYEEYQTAAALIGAIPNKIESEIYSETEYNEV